ncbi:MAG: glycosyl hydrolase family 28-related protein [Bacteroidota bacterium]|nr:glycosyl hydrolase family 28-related protein [Bacteroidota bacterium]
MAIETLTIADLRGKTSATTNNTYCTTDILQKGTWFYDNTDTTSPDNGNTIIVAPTAPQLTFKRIFDGVETTVIAGLRAKTSNTADKYYILDSGLEGLWYYDPSDTTSSDNGTTIIRSTSTNMRFKKIYNRIETSINQIRNALTQFTIGGVYYTTDIGQEGEWYYAGIDTVSIDNTGTILTSPPLPSANADRKVFKRIYDGYINVKWFGAIGDGTTDDIIAIQSAINWVSKTDYADIWNSTTDTQNKNGGGTVFFPEGVYRITKNILVGENCRLMGVSNEGGFDFPNITDNSSYNYKGSLICADYTVSFIEDPNYYWTIQSAACFTNTVSGIPDPHIPGDPLRWDEYAENIDFDLYYITHCEGIIIENLAIRPTYGQFEGGGIKLSGSGCSTIRNIQILPNYENPNVPTGASIGIMLSNCFGACSLDHVWMKIDVWGILVIGCNVVQISNTVINGFANNNTLYPEGELNPVPRFIQSLSYYENNLKLNDNVRRGRCGILSAGSQNLSITDTVWERIFNGLVLIQSSASLRGLYFEKITKYSIVCASESTANNGYLGILDANCLLFAAPTDAGLNICFFFGNGVFARISGVKPTFNTTYPHVPTTDLFVNNYSSELIRVISFANTILNAKRYYSPDIVFIDESPIGQNYGAVYINPNGAFNSSTNPYPGNDENYGFNEKDPVRTFDAALVRVHNQSTLNPVKTIYIKGAPIIGESVLPNEGAAYKNLEIVSLQNCDILITSYDTDGNKPRGRIFFEGTWVEEPIAQVGQIELLGNVNMYFRNVDLACNTPYMMPSDDRNLTLFGLRNSYSKLTFESNRQITSPPTNTFNIDMSGCYCLVQANFYDSIEANSLLDIKFVNIEISSGDGLSPIQNGNESLAIDCTQISSYQYTGSGWQDVEIIRNNLP